MHGGSRMHDHRPRAPLQRWDGARRVFTDQADIAINSTKREAA